MSLSSPRFRHALSIKHVALAAATFACSLVTCAATPEPAGFQHKDWELQCDNTRTCRAAGYQAEGDYDNPVSLLLSREAGPGKPVSIELQVQSETRYSGKLQLKAGRLVLRDLQGDPAQIPAAETPALIQQLLDNETVSISAGKQVWTLSLAGAKAVLLRMDEAQGRIGTPGALVRRGTKPESSVLPPLPVPVVKAVKPLATRPGDDALAQKAFASLSRKEREAAREECNDIDISRQVEGFRLDEHTLLIAMSCAMGAYNFTSLLWMADDKPPYRMRAQEADGEFDAATGALSSRMKGRGIGDCWSGTDWQYDGKGFALSGRSGDSMCRGFAGGAWNLPSHVSRIVPR